MLSKTRIYAVVLLLVFLIGFILSGCDVISGLSGNGIQELLQPPTSTGDNAEIKLTLEKSLGSSFTLVSPSSGDYRSAYNVCDLDIDHSNEAIVFYRQKSGLYVALLNQEEDSWVVREPIKSDATDVCSVGFYDLDNDSVKEIVIMWELNDSTTMKRLSVYEIVDNNLVAVNESSNPYIDCSEAVVIDMIPDNHTMEIVTFSLDVIVGVSKRAMARIYTYNPDTGSFVFKSHLQLDSKVASYAKITPASKMIKGENEYEAILVVDSYSDGQRTMLTEIILWDSNADSLTRKNIITFERESNVTSADVNGDGLIEIPTLTEFANTNAVGLTDNKYITGDHIIQWITYDTAYYMGTVKYTAINQAFNFMLVLPEAWINDAAFVENTSENECIIYKWDKILRRPAVDEDGNAVIYMAAKVFTLSEWKEYEEQNKDSTENVYRRDSIYGSLVYAVRFGDEGYPGYYLNALEIIK